MRRIVYFALTMAITSPATAYGKCADFLFQPVKSLSVQDIGRLDPPSAGRISIYWFDTEDHPYIGKRQGIAFISARLGDIAEQPVAGILYSDIRMELDAQKSNASTDAETVTFVSTQQGAACKKFHFSLYPDGRVTADGRSIGKVK